jgi:DNA-binding transcriptional ArsR family regulator
MTENCPDSEVQVVLDALADPECRSILDELGTPLSAQDVADRCDIPQTSAYRKLEALSEAGLVSEGTEIRTDGHHRRTYERDVSGVLVLRGTDPGFDVEFVDGQATPDQRLAQFWSRISEEL